jgi:HEPN domain-containing protein
MNQNVTYWLDMAEYDLETARAMLLTKRYLYVAFMCHQVIEKSFKAVIAGMDDSIEPPKIHNLVRLAELSALSMELSPQQKQFISILAPMNVEARYTAYKDEIAAGLSEQRCAELIKETEEMYSWIKKQL